jgi:single-stranded-DNA-specific exonuclease
VFSETIKNVKVTAQHIGFQLAPAVAAAGRLDWAESGFRFLIAESKTEAIKHWQVLQQENEQRKAIEKDLRVRAYAEATKMKSQSLVIFLEDGHSGVHGITASRLVERFGKPAAIFARKGSGARNSAEVLVTNSADGHELASGSFRGVTGIHIRDALQHVDDNNPGLLVSFGGHASAAGATIMVEDFELFKCAYEEAVCSKLNTQELQPEVWVDGDLDPSLLSVETVDSLGQLDPWGRDFPSPIFCSEFRVVNVKSVGDGSHLKLVLETKGQVIDAIWFSAVELGEVPPVAIGQRASFAYQLGDNVYRGQRKLQLQIVALA